MDALQVTQVEKDRQKFRSFFMRMLPKRLLYFGTHDSRHDPRPFLCDCWSSPTVDNAGRQFVPYARCEKHDAVVDWPLPKFEPDVDGLPLAQLALFPDLGEDNKKRLNDKIQHKLNAYVSSPQDRDDPRKLKARLQSTINKMLAEALRQPGEAVQKAQAVADAAASAVDGNQSSAQQKSSAGDKQHSGSSAAVEKLFRAHGELGAALDLFATRAKEACPGMSERDLHRAGTNAWPCLCLQILHGHPVDPHDAIVGFSLLYPLTDDILDSPSIGDAERKDFAKRFGQRIKYGDTSLQKSKSAPCVSAAVDTQEKPRSTRERRIWDAFALLEKRWPRKHHPALYRALAGLWEYQLQSSVQLYGMKHGRQPTLPAWDDIWRITVLKGSFSILCDFYLVNGGTTPYHLFGRHKHHPDKPGSARRKKHTVDPLSVTFAAHFGLYTQWINDLDGLESDIQEGQATPFGLIVGSRRTSTATSSSSSLSSGSCSEPRGLDEDEPGRLDGIVRACLTHLATTFGADSATTEADGTGSRHTSLASSTLSSLTRRRLGKQPAADSAGSSRGASSGNGARQKRKLKKAEQERRTMARSMQGFLALKMLMGVAKHQRHFSPQFLRECDKISPIRMSVLDRLGQLGEAIMSNAA